MASKSKTAKKTKISFRRGFGLEHLVIFMLVFANLGLGGLLASHADTSSNKVNFVVFCSSDQCSQNTSTLQSYATGIQNWYQGRVGRTFSIASVSLRRGAHPASYYYTNPTNGITGTGPDANTERAYYNVFAELAPASNVIDSVLLGFSAQGRCGLAAVPGNLAMTDPQSPNGCSGGTEGDMAHELGHSFGLVHTGTNSAASCSSTSSLRDYTLMDCYYACNGQPLPNCVLASVDKSQLYSSTYFVPATTPAPAGNWSHITSSWTGWDIYACKTYINAYGGIWQIKANYFKPSSAWGEAQLIDNYGSTQRQIQQSTSYLYGTVSQLTLNVPVYYTSDSIVFAEFGGYYNPYIHNSYPVPSLGYIVNC